MDVEDDQPNPWSLPPPAGQLRVDSFLAGSVERASAPAPAQPSNLARQEETDEAGMDKDKEPKPEKDSSVAPRRRKRKGAQSDLEPATAKSKAKPAKAKATSRARQAANPKAKSKPLAKAKELLKRPAASTAALNALDEGTTAPKSDTSADSSSTSSSSSSSSSSDAADKKAAAAKAPGLRFEDVADGVFFGEGEIGAANTAAEPPDKNPDGSSSPLQTELQPSRSDLDEEHITSTSSMFRYPLRHAKRVLEHFGATAFGRLRENLDGCTLLSLYSGLGGAELSLRLA